MRKLGLLAMPLMAISLLASCGSKPESKEYTITCTSNYVTLSNNVAKNNEDFNTTINNFITGFKQESEQVTIAPYIMQAKNTELNGNRSISTMRANLLTTNI